MNTDTNYALLQVKADIWVSNKLAQFAKDHAELMKLTQPSFHITSLIKEHTQALDDFYQGFHMWKRMGDIRDLIRCAIYSKEQAREIVERRRDWCERFGFDPAEFND
ncbi:hypothetical protein Aura_00168 [Pseudomonas phage vB_PpuM-Aura]